MQGYKTYTVVAEIFVLAADLIIARIVYYAPITLMPHLLPPTGHRRGLVHFYVLIPCPLGIFGGLIPGVILDFVKLS